MKKCTGPLVGQELQSKTRLFEAMVGVTDKTKNKIKNDSSSSSLEAMFLAQGFEVDLETWSPKNFPSNNKNKIKMLPC